MKIDLNKLEEAGYYVDYNENDRTVGIESKHGRPIYDELSKIVDLSERDLEDAIEYIINLQIISVIKRS